VIEESLKHSVNKIYMPNIDINSIEDMLRVEETYSECHSMMGLHPVSVKEDYKEQLKSIEDWLGRRRFAAIGEIGLDLYWDKTFYKEQLEVLRVQIDWAKDADIPVVIHCRETMQETIELVESLSSPKLKGVFHCFTGTIEQARRITDMGFYLGVGGIVTFKNGGFDKILPSIDLENILLETDSPYLAPVPFRGERNDPTKIPLIARKIAEIKGCDVEVVALKTTSNAAKLFNA
jgi:TatD DNase family protein